MKLKRFLQKVVFPFLIATLGKGMLKAILMTCRWKINGVEIFNTKASNEKSILMLWHNRLAIIPFILERYASQFNYTAVISKSRDGDLISAVVKSYKQGKIISVSHQARHQALKEMIETLESKESVVVITPDGPRGPCYEVKPGIATAALETGAFVFPMTWEASKAWTLNTWDKMQIPKPFSTITVTFKEPVTFLKEQNLSLEQATRVLQQALK